MNTDLVQADTTSRRPCRTVPAAARKSPRWTGFCRQDRRRRGGRRRHLAGHALQLARQGFPLPGRAEPRTPRSAASPQLPREQLAAQAAECVAGAVPARATSRPRWKSSGADVFTAAKIGSDNEAVLQLEEQKRH